VIENKKKGGVLDIGVCYGDGVVGVPERSEASEGIVVGGKKEKRGETPQFCRA
jgi:hypothetical protein